MEPTPKVRKNAKASKVRVTKADGTTELQPAYNGFELQRVVNGANPQAKSKRRKAKRAKKRMIPIWRTTKTGKRVVYGPLEKVRAGKQVTVHGKDSVDTVTIATVGKPFNVGGTLMVYGYLTAGDGHSHTVGDSLQTIREKLR